MNHPSQSALAGTLTLKFASPEALAEALQAFAGERGVGGLCLRVQKHYELGDKVRLQLDWGDGLRPLGGVVTWRRPGHIGARFQPSTADETQTLAMVRQLIAQVQRPGVAPPVAGALPATKPFAE